MELTTAHVFQSAVYRAEAPQFLEETNRVCDPHIQKAKDKTKEQIEAREAKVKRPIGDIGLSYHTENLMTLAILSKI